MRASPVASGSTVLDPESQELLQALKSSGRAYDDACARLHALLLRAARFEVARRRRGLTGLEADTLATEAADDALRLTSNLPDAHELRGLLAERAGDDDRARRELAIARRLDRDRYPKPIEMSEDEFLAVAQDAVAELDDDIKEILEETSFFVQPFPADELLHDSEPPLDPQILGLFVGRSLLERSVAESGTMPNTMYLFQRNLERSAATREELEEEIRITVLHEIDKTGSKFIQAVSGGWPKILSGLKTLLETGAPLPDMAVPKK